MEKVVAMFGELTTEQQVFPLIKQAFGSHYQLKQELKIDDWLKTHFIYITPINAIQYLHNGDMKQLIKDRQALQAVNRATQEGFAVLKSLGYIINPSSMTTLINHRHINYWFNQIYHRLPMNRVVSGSPKEIEALLRAFHQLKLESTVATPTWDKIEHNFMNKYQ